jgi:hypothetical protein
MLFHKRRQEPSVGNSRDFGDIPRASGTKKLDVVTFVKDW